jgi:AraC-like DNA-binding protein
MKTRSSLIYRTIPLLEDQNMVQLLLDRRGIIVKSSPNPEKLLGFLENDITGKSLTRILIPLDSNTSQFIENISRTDVQIGRDMYVKSKKPEFLVDYGVFMISSSEWFTFGNKKYRIISLFPQSYNSPVTQKLMTLYRSTRIPMILMDEKFELKSYNYQFLEILNFQNQETIMNHSVFELLDKEYRDLDIFVLAKTREYAKKAAGTKARPWKIMASPVSDERTARSMLRICPQVKFMYRDKSVCLSNEYSTQEPYAAMQPVVSLAKVVNLPNLDLEVDLTLKAENRADLTMALSYPYTGTRHLVFDPAYNLDIGINSALSFAFLRRSAPVVLNTNVSTRSSRTIVLKFKRAGAFFTLNCNGREVFSYADPVPLFGMQAAFLNFYLWNGNVKINDLTVKTRPTELKLEEMEALESRIVAFASAPGKPFRFEAEPVSYLNGCGLAVRFYPIPVLSQIHSRDRTTTFFEESRRYIQENYFRKIDFQSLAKRCCVCYKYFIQKFKQHYGRTPKAYQTEIKLNETQTLLKSGKFSLREIREMVGFEDEANFHHVFKKHFGVSPLKWRK